MSSNPLNLALRFLLEVSALVALGVWGWQRGEGVLGLVLAVGVPLLAAALWGTFAVPADRPSGEAPVPVPGFARLLLELALFAAAVWALNDAGYSQVAWILGGVAVFHYVVSYDRIVWLIRQ